MANNVSQPLAKHKYLIIERQQCKLIRVVAPILYLEWYHIVRDTIRGARPGLQRKLCQYPIILKSRLLPAWSNNNEKSIFHKRQLDCWRHLTWQEYEFYEFQHLFMAFPFLAKDRKESLPFSPKFFGVGHEHGHGDDAYCIFHAGWSYVSVPTANQKCVLVSPEHWEGTAAMLDGWHIQSNGKTSLNPKGF